MGFDPSEEDSNPAFSTRLEVPFRAQQLEQTPRAPGRIVEIPELPQVPVGGRRSHRGLSNRLSAPSRGPSEPHVRPEGDRLSGRAEGTSQATGGSSKGGSRCCHHHQPVPGTRSEASVGPRGAISYG